MTFCLGVKVADGLVGLADTRVTSGSECITARKSTVIHHGGHAMFLMTSGLRSVRDKALTYFQEALDDSEVGFDRLYKAVNALAGQLRRVADEDKAALEAANLPFNSHALVGGQLEHDSEPKLYLLYPQGNWVEVGPGTPYCIIGETGYGKPILDRTLKYDDSMEMALRVGVLAFDSTRISSTTVDFPLDVVVYDRRSREMIPHRFEKHDLAESSRWWQERLRANLLELPSSWVERVFGKLEAGDNENTIRLPDKSGSP
jgi:putative proteasome-type protease